jgi:hypothetical protein
MVVRMGAWRAHRLSPDPNGPLANRERRAKLARCGERLAETLARPPVPETVTAVLRRVTVVVIARLGACASLLIRCPSARRRPGVGHVTS